MLGGRHHRGVGLHRDRPRGPRDHDLPRPARPSHRHGQGGRRPRLAMAPPALDPCGRGRGRRPRGLGHGHGQARSPPSTATPGPTATSPAPFDRSTSTTSWSTCSDAVGYKKLDQAAPPGSEASMTFSLPEVRALPRWSPCLFRDKEAVSGVKVRKLLFPQLKTRIGSYCTPSAPAHAVTRSGGSVC
jgi:hypothetical protein